MKELSENHRRVLKAMCGNLSNTNKIYWYILSILIYISPDKRVLIDNVWYDEIYIEGGRRQILGTMSSGSRSKLLVASIFMYT